MSDREFAIEYPGEDYIAEAKRLWDETPDEFKHTIRARWIANQTGAYPCLVSELPGPRLLDIDQSAFDETKGLELLRDVIKLTAPQEKMLRALAENPVWCRGPKARVARRLQELRLCSPNYAKSISLSGPILHEITSTGRMWLM